MHARTEVNTHTCTHTQASTRIFEIFFNYEKFIAFRSKLNKKAKDINLFVTSQITYQVLKIYYATSVFLF